MLEQVVRRLSVREYSSGVTENEMRIIDEFIKNIKPLFGAKADYSIIGKEEFYKEIKGRFIVEAPHYLLLRGKEDRHTYIDTGLAGELFCLKLTEMNIGTCWLGGARSVIPDNNFIIGIAFGHTGKEFRAEVKEFKRKKIADMAVGDITAHSEAIERARLSPSGMNLQTCSIEALSSDLIIYRKKSNINMFNRMSTIDLGIFLSHILLDGSYKIKSDDNKPAKGQIQKEFTLTK